MRVQETKEKNSWWTIVSRKRQTPFILLRFEGRGLGGWVAKEVSPPEVGFLFRMASKT